MFLPIHVNCHDIFIFRIKLLPTGKYHPYQKKKKKKKKNKKKKKPLGDVLQNRCS